MKTTGFTTAQKQALIDLLLMGMYADHALTSAEEKYIRGLFDKDEFPSDYDWQKFSDAAYTRIRGSIGSPETLTAYVRRLAKAFRDVGTRTEVLNTVREFLASDSTMNTGENKYLRIVEDAFKK